MLVSQKINHQMKITKKIVEQIEQMSLKLSSECEKAVIGITKIDREAVPSRRG